MKPLGDSNSVASKMLGWGAGRALLCGEVISGNFSYLCSLVSRRKIPS